MSLRSLLVILSDSGRTAWAQELIAAAKTDVQPIVLTGTPLQAAQYMQEHQTHASHIVLDIGMRGQDVLPEIDQLAQQCEAGTRVLAIGDTNDIILYRGLISRGVIDYLPMPVAIPEVIRVLTAPAVAAAAPVAAPVHSAPQPSATAKKRVIAFMSSASGDGASMAALNCAYAMSQMGKSTVLVDMDYQFGMVAKNLNLQNQYGIGDLFDHPDRGLDATLIKRMVADYQDLHVITAPADLRFMPNVSEEAIKTLINTLKQNYDNVILDLPHVWLPWISSVVQQTTDIVLVAQLWLKSVSHAARMMRVFRDLGISTERVHMVINRGGARFKEGIDPKDFSRVTNAPIRYTLANDIKSIVNAEASARTVMEGGGSDLANDILTLANGLLGQKMEAAAAPAAKGSGGLFSRLKG